MLESFVARLRDLFDVDESVERVVHDPALTAELLLLFRVVLADGKVEQVELDAIKRIAHEAFGIGPVSFSKVVRYLQDFGYETSARQAADIFRALPFERKASLVRHMEEIARADNNLDEREAALIRRTIALLNEDPPTGKG
ncbi:MAG: TerB family tellurite resistance protein [Notoacmeibacter sp.]|nr:TerB family tellurite resistance protein [Notoacmeibacter sp.]MCC0032178.1 TerB family tellurite resistance protein [Brucellaceae bacterium]